MKRFKVWLVLGLIFLAGFAGGVVTTRVVVHRVVRAAILHPEFVRARIERDLDRKLKLDARQRGEVHQVLLHSYGELRQLRLDSQPRLASILGETRRQISAVLTPGQQQRFDNYLAAHPLPAAPAADSRNPE
jgi:hypothetical protein